MTELRYNQTSPEVKKLQLALLAKGYKLPKYGADGNLGGETWARLELFAGVEELDASKPLPASIIQALLNTPEVKHPDGYVRVKGDPSDVHGMRSWQQVDTIMLHQTGIWMNDTPDRFDTVNAHVGILKDHATPIVQVHDLLAYCHHGNKANGFSIGIEINGHFPGLVKAFDPKRHSSAGPSERQIQSTRKALAWIMEEAKAGGGQIRHIIPHRTSNGSKPSDPGEVAWKEIGIWAQNNLGLADKGPGWLVGTGVPIPGDWDGRAQYQKYKYA